MSTATLAAAAKPLDYPPVEPWIRLGYFMIFGVFGALLVWATFAEINSAVVGAGQVAVETNIKTVQHLDGGIVAALKARNGDRVKEGAILIRLDDTAAKANLAITWSRLVELYIQRARLDAEFKELPEIVVTPEVKAEVEAEPRVAAFFSSQQSLFKARRDRQKGETSVLREQRQQLEKQIAGMSAAHDSNARQAELIRREMESVKPLLEQGLYTMSRMLALERESARLDGEVGRLKGDMARVRGAMGEIDVKILQVTKEAMQQVLTDLREAQGKIAELEEQKIAIEDKLKRIDIRAPRSGYVHNSQVHTIGGVVSPGTPILEIIPEDDRLIIETRVSPHDIDQIKIGQLVNIRFPSFNQRTTPILEGKVIKRSAATLADKSAGPMAGQPYYTLTVEVPPTELAKIGEGKTLIPGMQSEVYVTTGERSVLSFFMKPLADQIWRVGRER